jgi:hypothetical protein
MVTVLNSVTKGVIPHNERGAQIVIKEEGKKVINPSHTEKNDTIEEFHLGDCLGIYSVSINFLPSTK